MKKRGGYLLKLYRFSAHGFLYAVLLTFGMSGCISLDFDLNPRADAGSSVGNENNNQNSGNIQTDGSIKDEIDSSGGNFGNIGTGGAQDIGLFRQILEEGGIPGENTLCANGFFSEHYTELPPPECGHSICLHGMLAIDRDWIFDQYQAAIQLGMNSPLDPATFQRRDIDIAVVIDVSGSMDQEMRLDFVKEGLRMLIDELRPDDRIALIKYSGQAHLVFGFEDNLTPAQMHNEVNALQAGGGTNFYAGLELGFQTVEEVMDLAREPRVIMMSDGIPTFGIWQTDQIIAMAETYIEKGIGLTTIGVGTDLNIDLMRGLAELGTGNFYFLENAAAIEDVFLEELDYFVSPIAFNLKASVTVNSIYYLREVVGTNLWKTKGNGGMIEIPSLFLVSRTSHDEPPAESGEGRRGGGSAIFLAMEPVEDYNQENEDVHFVADINLSYEDGFQDGALVQLEETITNPAQPGQHPLGQDPPEPWVSHAALKKNLAIYNIYLGLREACRRAATSHNYALWILNRLLEKTEEWNAEVEDEDIAADILLIEKFRANLIDRGATPVEPPGPAVVFNP